MPWFKIRLSDAEYDALSKVTKDHNLSISEVINYGIDYVNTIHSSKSLELSKKTDDFLLKIMQKSFESYINDFRNKATEEFQKPKIQEELKKEIMSEIKSETIKQPESRKKKLSPVKKKSHQ